MVCMVLLFLLLQFMFYVHYLLNPFHAVHELVTVQECNGPGDLLNLNIMMGSILHVPKP